MSFIFDFIYFILREVLFYLLKGYGPKDCTTHHFTHGPKHDMDAYMTTLFEDEAWDL